MEDRAHEPRDGRLARAGVAGEDEVERRLSGWQPLGCAVCVYLHEVRELGYFPFDALEADQALKLRVRDRVLERATELLEQSADRQEAEALLRGNLLELENLAAEEIAAAGYDYPVTAELTDTTFPTREYDGFTLPAGEYLALRIVIGEGAGQNWWCVVFPPLCTTASADVPASALAAGLTQEDVNLITEEPGYVLKFKTVELWERLRAALEG